MRPDAPHARMLGEILGALGLPGSRAAEAAVTGRGALRSAFEVTDLASASIAAVGLMLADWIRCRGGPSWPVSVERRLASFWFRGSLRGQGWSPPAPWDAVAGDYRTRDGWIRLHTNAPHHRAAALRVLDAVAQRDVVAAAVAGWEAQALEDAVVAAGGCAAAMRSAAEWSVHPQGAAVAAEPLLACGETPAGVTPGSGHFDPARPLAGVRVLDLTRVLAGPVATRTLAAYGADVLRIDPPDWEEPPIVPEMTPGKRTARLDLRLAPARERLEALLGEADVLVHGYRSDALERLGLGEERRQALRPGLVDVALDAYGWSGPWARRRGFDSLVQMSAGIADAGMGWAGVDMPRPLPVQALDHATGYLMAAAAIRGLVRRHEAGCGWRARASLARTAVLLSAHRAHGEADALAPPAEADWNPAIESTAWGPARRLHAPLRVGPANWRWDRPAGPLGAGPASWA